MPRDNDYELLYFIHAKDEIAFRYLFHKYERSIRFFIHKYYNKKDRRNCEDDLIQLSRIKLLHAIDNYRDEKGTPFSFFYFEILEHLMIDNYRYRYSDKGAYERFTISIDTLINDQQASYLVDSGASNQYYEVCKRIEEGKLKLKPIERDIIDLRIEGYSYSQISDNLQIKEKKIEYAIKKMRKQKYD